LILVEYRTQLARRAKTIQTASTIGFTAIALIGVQALVFAFLILRLRYALDREHGVVEALQVAFAGTVNQAPALEAATAYVSATRGAKVGGDVYDVYRIDEDLTLVLIADVSGKGVDAAVDTMFVKYSLRAFATEHRDIRVIANKFNTLYAHAQKEPEAFVVLFCGFYDRRTSTLTYINAGHEAAYVCRTNDVEQLPPTDAIIGLTTEAEFHTASVLIDTQSILFLATDGLTEARDPAGRFLGSAGVQQWLRDADMRSPQALVTDISDRLRRYTGANINDDLAILALRPKSA
jgi:sigma-B regulation protein RsbU (phosphoserine phosphatase)